MRKVNFSFVILPVNFKDNICPAPFAAVLSKVKVVVHHVPNDFLARHEFGDVKCTTVKILVVVVKLSTELVSTPLNGL